MSGSGPLRAPAEDGATVVSPLLAATGALLDANRRRLAALPPLLGRDAAALRRQARHAVVEAARTYLSRLGEPLPDNPSEAIVMAGHQPELFHPGVWVKNFALNGLARRHRLTALNLIVDNDTLKAAALRLPAPPGAESPWPHLATIPFDVWTGEVPWEERSVADPDRFATFSERCLEVLRGWHYEPLLPAFWEDVLRSARQQPLLGKCFSAARRALERRWGCHNLEVPVSAVCRTEPFAWFACHLLAELPRFHAVYNRCVAEYRLGHGIRSRNHPVPDLAADNGWLETPFWGWRAGQARRGRLFARHTAAGVELRAGDEPWPSLPPIGRDAATAVAAWGALETAGLKVRSRALTNTLFARLFLADLFMHGIGGGKYDELTDEILRRFYDVEPPYFMVLSATRLLPLPAFPVDAEGCRRLARAARDLQWNPQRHLPADAKLRELADEKAAWIAREPADKRERRERFEALRRLTERLRVPLREYEQKMREKLLRCEHELEANAVLRRRDFAFCLYPEALLRPFCERFLHEEM